MSVTDAEKATVWEGGSPINLARTLANDGAAAQQADVSTCNYMVTKVVSGTVTEVVASTSLTVTDVIFDTLQTDAIWTEDATGYNFKHQLSASDLPDGGVTYTVIYKLVDGSSNASFLDFELTTKEQPFD